MKKPSVLITLKSPIRITNHMSAEIDVGAKLVIRDSLSCYIPTFLEENGVTLVDGEEYLIVFGFKPPEQMKANIDKLFAMLNAEPTAKEAAEWLLARTYGAGFNKGVYEGGQYVLKW